MYTLIGSGCAGFQAGVFPKTCVKMLEIEPNLRCYRRIGTWMNEFPTGISDERFTSSVRIVELGLQKHLARLKSFLFSSPVKQTKPKIIQVIAAETASSLHSFQRTPQETKVSRCLINKHQPFLHL